METEKYISLIKEYSKKNYKAVTMPPTGDLIYPYIIPGSASYRGTLWDWDSWLTDVAISQIRKDNTETDGEYEKYEKGCVLNFLNFIEDNGYIPICICSDNKNNFVSKLSLNAHKPCLCQHAVFIVRRLSGEMQWLNGHIKDLKKFVSFYINNCKDEGSGLYFWLDDGAIGVDNDPCTFYRPNGSSASIFLNCLMYKELEALIYLCRLMGEECEEYKKEYDCLNNAVRREMWDERDGAFYSVDINLKPINTNELLHSGAPRHWNSLLQRIDVWSNFMPMWAGIATKEQAKNMVYRHMLNPETFYSNYGIRSLSAKEKMYAIKKTGNPSCWLGPVWGISNYMCFKGLADYGFYYEARELAVKTVKLFGQDIEKNGELHEYYHPDTGEGINNPGFQSWNLLINNMIAMLEEMGM